MILKSKIMILLPLLLLVSVTSSLHLVNAESMTPLKQVQAGIPLNQIQCNDDKILMISPRDKPICITIETADILVIRGYKLVSVIDDDMSFESNIEISKTNWSSKDFSKSEAEIQPSVKIMKLESINSTDVKPILNPKFDIIRTLIPQDQSVNNLLKLPPQNPDEFVSRMLELYDDKIVEKNYSKSGDLRYFTEKGFMEFSDQPLRYYNFKYTIYGADRIPERYAEEYTYNFIETLGLSSDTVGKPKYCDEPTCHWTYDFGHYKDDWFIGSDVIVTSFMPGYTEFYARNWHVNYTNVELFDLNQSRQNAIEYLLTIDELRQPHCNVKYNRDHSGGHEALNIIEERFVYNLYAGTCQTPYSDGHYNWYAVIVDAITGVPLYAENKMVF